MTSLRDSQQSRQRTAARTPYARLTIPGVGSMGSETKAQVRAALLLPTGVGSKVGSKVGST